MDSTIYVIEEKDDTGTWKSIGFVFVEWTAQNMLKEGSGNIRYYPLNSIHG